MGDRTTTIRAQAIEGFAALLADLRDSVGKPSFRVMAGRSQAISHTTLHEAVHGNRLPSWATTAEFVKACGADPRLYRDRWDEANRTVASVTHGGCRPIPAAPRAELGRSAREAPEPVRASGDVPDLTRGARVPTKWRPGRRALVGTAALVVSVATSLGAVWSAGGAGDPAASRATAHTPAHLATGVPAPVAADCPVHQQDPPAAPPAHEGDRATFVADLTMGDCSHVRAGQTLAKVWRLKNTGSVPWVGYSLHRIDLPQGRGQCQTISDVPVHDTAPGQVVDVTVGVSVPATPTFCLVRFKLVDARGDVAFPGNRPVNFQVIVDSTQPAPAKAAGSGT